MTQSPSPHTHTTQRISPAPHDAGSKSWWIHAGHRQCAHCFTIVLSSYQYSFPTISAVGLSYRQHSPPLLSRSPFIRYQDTAEAHSCRSSISVIIRPGNGGASGRLVGFTDLRERKSLILALTLESCGLQSGLYLDREGCYPFPR